MLSFVLHVIGDWLGDELEVNIQKNREIFLSSFDDVLDALVESVNEFEVCFVVIGDSGEDLSPSFSILWEKFDDFLSVEEVHRLVEEGYQASFGEVFRAFNKLHLPLSSTLLRNPSSS